MPIEVGLPRSWSELPTLRCAPAANRAVKFTVASLLLVTATVKVYDQSAAAGLKSTGAERNTTFDEATKL